MEYVDFCVILQPIYDIIMADTLLNKISKHPNNTIVTDAWLTGQTGEIVDLQGNCVFRFIDYIDSPELRIKHTTEESQLSCPVVACGLVGYWLHKKRMGVLAGHPFFMSYFSGFSLTTERYLRMLPDLMICPLVFYINYFYLIDRFLFHKNISLYILLNFVLFAICISVMVSIFGFTHPKNVTPPGLIRDEMFKATLLQKLVGVLLHQGISIVFFIALSVAIKMTYNSYVKDVTIKTYEMEKKEAELASLKSQLNPHFLFNSLNTIYVLAAIDADKTQYAVHHLSDMLRYVLYESNNEALPLSKEINFIKSYTELMKIRYQGVVSIKEHYCTDCQGIEIAPMMFIALVENAFKHGISTIEPSFVHINIDVKDRSIVCQVENSNHPRAVSDHTSSGIGLGNLKRRLDFLYEDRYSFITDIIENKYVAELIIHT